MVPCSFLNYTCLACLIAVALALSAEPELRSLRLPTDPNNKKYGFSLDFIKLMRKCAVLVRGQLMAAHCDSAVEYGYFRVSHDHKHISASLKPLLVTHMFAKAY